MKVLVVEDDLVLQMAVKKVFDEMGFETILCSDGETAFKIITTEKIRLAIIDWILPGIDGLTLCRKMRKLRLSRYVYMIILTSMSSKENLVEALDAGADDFIAKPFDENELAARARVGMRIIQLENKLVNSQKKLIKLAKEDPLTGIMNRRSLFDEILKELNRASREKSSVATILVDADNFKAINDTYGHLVGDMVLVQLAESLKDCCREYDKLGRYGGEEFLLLLPQTDREGAIHVAERMRRHINNNPINCGDKSISLTVSIGVSTISFGAEHEKYKINEQMMDDLIKKTDYALYVAKKEGKNRVAVYGSV